MKNLFRSTILLIFCLPGLIFTSCAHDEEVAQHIVPQASRSACERLTTSDLDLSEGFRGSYQSNPSNPDIDFSISGHDAMYPFSEEVDAGDCDGICAFKILFEQANPNNPVEAAQLQVTNVTLTYIDGGSLVTNFNIAYDWNYPYLEVHEVATNAVMAYDVSFANNLGSGLAVADVEVIGGLCVIDNVDILDPIKVINISSYNNHNQ